MRSKLLFLTIVFIFTNTIFADDFGFDTELSFAPDDQTYMLPLNQWVPEEQEEQDEQDEQIELQNDWYLIPNAGMGSVADYVEVLSGDSITVKFDTGTSLGFSIGKRTSDGLRWQFDYSNVTNDVETVGINGVFSSVDDLANALGADTGSADVEQTALILNAIWDFGDESSTFKPYLGLGIGKVAVEVTADFTLDGTPYSVYFWDWYTAFQGIAGFRMNLSPTSDCHIGYRYLNVNGDVENVISNTISLGLGFKF